MNTPDYASRIDKALEDFPPELVMDAKKSLNEFLTFSRQDPASKGESPWNYGESLSYLAGYIAGRADKLVKSN